MDRKLTINHLSFIIRKSVGFTLIELMVAISITAVLGTLGIAGFTSYNKAQALQTSTNEVVTMLNSAKSRAQSQVKLGSVCNELSPYLLKGYKVEILASDETYLLKILCEGTADEVITKKTLPPNVIFTSGESSFFFPVQKGGVETVGSITISSGGKTRTITVNSLGGVSVSSP